MLWVGRLDVWMDGYWVGKKQFFIVCDAGCERIGYTLFSSASNKLQCEQSLVRLFEYLLPECPRYDSIGIMPLSVDNFVDKYR